MIAKVSGITKLKGPSNGVITTSMWIWICLQPLSRMVGWMVATQENSRLAHPLIAELIKQAIVSGDLTLQSDRGSSMSFKALALLLADLGVSLTLGLTSVTTIPTRRPNSRPSSTGPNSRLDSAPSSKPEPFAGSSSIGTRI